MKKQRRYNGKRCYYCPRVLAPTTSLSKVAATRDHVHPKSKGGKRTVWACRQCNELKGDMTLTEWEKFMLENPEWWKRPESNKISRPKFRRPSGMTAEERKALVAGNPASRRRSLPAVPADLSMYASSTLGEILQEKYNHCLTFN